MDRRSHCNIPTEILRTLVTIVETGSFTKAGDRLGMSQAGISAQIKRLQNLVGGPPFDRVSGGVKLSERGKLLFPLAWRLLETNDQILRIGGSARDLRPISLGLNNLYVPALLGAIPKEMRGDVTIRCGGSERLTLGLTNASIDIACMLNPPHDFVEMVEEWDEEMIWVRSKDFVLSPGAPVPLISWPGLISDRLGMAVLQQNGTPYKLIFDVAGMRSRLLAVASGWGVMVIPRRALESSVVVANDYYLPSLPCVRAGLCSRLGLDSRRIEPILRSLKDVFPLSSTDSQALPCGATI
jgi:DNA-binding transcriptional LysR family regulator